MTSITDLYSSLERCGSDRDRERERERQRERERERERRPVRQGEIMLVRYGNSVM